MTHSVLDAIAAAAEKYPQATALTFNNQRLSYVELERCVETVRQQLIKNDICSGQALGIYLERSQWLVVSILAILKHGCSYIPLDTQHPADRTQFIIEDANIQCVISSQAQTRLNKLVEQQLLLDFDAIQASAKNNDAVKSQPLNHTSCPIEPNSQAYSIYTSGTTGTPKGVKVSHHNLQRLFETTEQLFKFKQSDVWCLFHSPSFDFSVWEIFGALVHGAQLVIVPSEISKQSDLFYQLVIEHKVSVLNQTPSAFYQFTAIDAEYHAEQNEKQENISTHLRYVIFGGEALTPSKLKSWIAKHPLENTQLINMYGITETTVHVSFKALSSADIEHGDSSNIGKPLPDLTIYLRDEQGKIVAKNQQGEMLITGAGVSLGYHNRVQLNTQKFIDLQLPNEQHSVKAYCSGDVAIELDNGDFQYLGRIDRQVKVRGFRIELGEIENQMLTHAQVKQCIVIAHQYSDTDTRLIAFIVADANNELAHDFALTAQDSTVDSDVKIIKNKDIAKDIIKHLKKSLADYMLPAELFFIKKIPLNANHKADTKKFEQLLIAFHQRSAENNKERAHALQSSELEESLLEIWQTLLQTKTIDKHSQFHELGGHSLLAVQMLTKIKMRWGISIKMRQLREDFSIAKVAKIIEQQTEL